MPTPTPTDARRYLLVVLLTVTIAGVALAISAGANDPASFGWRNSILRSVAIGLSAFLAYRGISWSRWLLVLVAGIAGVAAVFLALIYPLPLWWRLLWVACGAVSVWGVSQLFWSAAAKVHFPKAPQALPLR